MEGIAIAAMIPIMKSLILISNTKEHRELKLNMQMDSCEDDWEGAIVFDSDDAHLLILSM